jgi:hypothetical protein
MIKQVMTEQIRVKSHYFRYTDPRKEEEAPLTNQFWHPRWQTFDRLEEDASRVRDKVCITFYVLAVLILILRYVAEPFFLADYLA